MLRKVRAVAVALVLGMLAGACSSSGDGGTTGSTQAVRQVMSVGLGADTYVLTGPGANLGNGLNIAEPLVLLGPNYELKPLLAERWEFIPPTTWRFKLRSGVRFHDGQALTAQAVKVGLFDRVAGTGPLGKGTVTVVDELTIDFTPASTNLRVPEQIAHPRYSVYAPGSDVGTKPVGTGPFRFVSYAPKERLQVERNPDYWGPKAVLDEITFRFFADDSTRRLALEAGDVDFIVTVPRQDVASLRGAGFEVATAGPGGYEALLVNIQGAPPRDSLSDVQVRLAAGAAIDRAALVSGVLDGLATTDPTFVPAGSLGSYRSQVKGVSFDRNRAGTLLDAAGWRAGSDGVRAKDGRRLKLTLVVQPPTSAHGTIPAYLQAQLRQIGVEVAIVEPPDNPAYGDVLSKGDGDLFLERGFQNDANPAFLPIQLFSSRAEPEYMRLFAPGGRFDELLAPALTEADADRVRRATADALHELIDVQAVVIPLAGIYGIYAYRKTVKGFEPSASFQSTRWLAISRVAGG